MRSVDVFELFDKTWNNSIPEKRMAQLKLVRNQVPEEHHELFDGMLDARLAGVNDSPEATVVLLIHGIQTDGAWHQLVQKEVGSLPHTNVIGLGYDVVSPLQLALPFRGTPVDKIKQDIRDARRQEPLAKFVVIAHSFGSYILSRILPKSTDIEFEKIILCGCIIPINFPWGHYTRGMSPKSVINDVGTRDFYPVMATFTTFGYGSSGRKGFQNPHIKDRYFNYGHSDFFDSKYKHIETYWKPFIADGSIIESDWDQSKPKTALGILMLCHPWIGRTLFYSTLASVIGFGAFALFA
jgi:pimeloyl-ACP methyl ester carboxylesterase